ncbi:MAG: 4-(cytidine 5'-diphospho)-2-C-methyl-D-erythritol kinase [Treponemataceae bacterium]|nr:MAG: 4-(cytidine 5'-diphospho)-2-C-methyl-D-erythritol kinase [Treponemataceae bacterium]
MLAPAKINIGLAVSPGSDGYHNIESVFQTVGLCDELEVVRQDGAGIVVCCKGVDIPAQNTLSAAYETFCKEAAALGRDGASLGTRVTLEKRIPQGAGLGGGSSDAAAFVRALEAVHGVCLDNTARTRIASRVGSDVFFFTEAFSVAEEERLSVRGGCRRDGQRLARRRGGAPPLMINSFAAVVTGRGEYVRRIRTRDDLFFVLVYPGVCVSTRDSFALLDAEGVSGGENPPVEELEAMYRADVRLWRFANSFTKPVSRAFPEIAQALDDVRETGAVFADMSGSGSAVFGVYEAQKDADSAVSRLKQKWESCWGTFT